MYRPKSISGLQCFKSMECAKSKNPKSRDHCICKSPVLQIGKKCLHFGHETEGNLCKCEILLMREEGNVRITLLARLHWQTTEFDATQFMQISWNNKPLLLRKLLNTHLHYCAQLSCHSECWCLQETQHQTQSVRSQVFPIRITSQVEADGQFVIQAAFLSWTMSSVFFRDFFGDSGD